MIVLLGDIHGDFCYLPTLLKDIPKDATIIQVGDFGFWPNLYRGHYVDGWEQYWAQCEWEGKFYFIDGNHESHPDLQYSEITEVWPGAHFIPRGHVMEIDGLTIGFMGGAASIDSLYRTEGHDWFREERITQEQFDAMYNMDVELDLLVTHTPPSSVISGNFSTTAHLSFGQPDNWYDTSAVFVQQLYEKFDCPLICGHMHKHVIDGKCRILDINEVYMFPVSR